MPSADDVIATLTITTLWANSADDKLVIFSLLIPESRIWNFMQSSIGDNLHEVSDPVFREKHEKIFQYVVCWKFYSEC